MSLSNISDKIRALLGQPLSEEETMQLLRESVEAGAGLTIDLDAARYRVVLRDGKFALKLIERKRPSTIPPFR